VTIILGLNAYHGDSSACLVRDGEIVAAAEEERFRRIKHWAGFPSEAIRYCLAEARVSLTDVEHVAINSDPRSSFFKKVEFTLKHRPDLGLVIHRLRNQVKRHSVEAELAAAFPEMPFKGTVHRVEHHTAHLASAFLVSPFQEASVVSVDGFGDFSSAAWGIGSGEEEARLRQRSAELGIADRIAWHGGTVGERQIAEIANTCKVFTYAGSVGLILIHGFAYGLPAIVHYNRWEHGPEIAALRPGENGVTFKQGDATSLAKAAAALVSDPHRLSTMSAAAIATTEQSFNASDMAERFCRAVALLDQTEPSRSEPL
jgi:glycosyltransferase involved in cell wall biosynthesis